MRINDPRGPKDVNVAGASHAKKAAGAEGEVKAQKGAHGDVKVNVSAKARELAEQSKVDEAKVARLRDKIEQGEFKIDARAIASKLMGEE